MTGSAEAGTLAGGALDEALARGLVEEALLGASDGELFLEDTFRETYRFEAGRLSRSSYDRQQGFGLRGVFEDAVGYASSHRVDIATLRGFGATIAGARSNRSFTFAAPPAVGAAPAYDGLSPVQSPDFADKVALLGQIDAYLREADPRVREVTITLDTAMQSVEILRPDQAVMRDRRPLVKLNITVVVEAGGLRESRAFGFGGRHGFARVAEPASWRGAADEALRQALVALDSEPAPAGTMEIVLGPGWPGILLHEAIGHGLEADLVARRESVFSEQLGQRIAAPGVHVVDDGSLFGERGSLSFDDEGTPTGPTTLVEDGILVGFMHDRRTARRMQAVAGGNGRRQSFAHKPMVRMTNTFMRNGDLDPAEIIGSVKSGLYAVSFGGGEVDITSGQFVFTCTEAYRIENGVLGAPVKGAVLVGNGRDALKGISLIGNDGRLDPGIGLCGKYGQLLPVSVGQPTIRIAGLTIGGTGS